MRARRSPVLARDSASLPAANAPEPLHPQRALALDTPVSEPRARSSGHQRLWFCVYLPRLPLEACHTGSEACALVEEQQGMHRVVLASAEAQAAGVQAGQSTNAALALLPALRIEVRNPLQEQRCLEQLAGWLERYSSVVCFAGQDVLLLEIAGSLRLYGGLKALRRQMAAGLAEQGFMASLAIAPTPLAATWLARAGQRACVREPDNLMAALRRLPLDCLQWPQTIQATLLGMGITHVGDCLRLPRDGFARRFGPQRLLELDRALGRLPDPRNSWRSPERFCADYDMTEEQSDREQLLAICAELLGSLEGFLLARQLGTQHLRFSFFHLRESASVVSLRSATAERQAAHWNDLLRIRFEPFVLPEPVIAVRLQAGRLQALQAVSSALPLQTGRKPMTARHSMTQLADRLAARIGRQSVRGLDGVADFRPQQAWRYRDLLQSDVVEDTHNQWLPGRPLWLLPEPAELLVEQGCPLHQGPLQLTAGPERLETGWWDEDSISRDYYTAINPAGMRLWVFRNRSRDARWYLHGFFG